MKQKQLHFKTALKWEVIHMWYAVLEKSVKKVRPV